MFVYEKREERKSKKTKGEGGGEIGNKIKKGKEI